MPKYLAERWENGGAKEVGKLKIVRAPNQKPFVTFSMHESLVGELPGTSELEHKTAISKDHTFVMSNLSNQSLAVFSVASSDAGGTAPISDKLALVGKVVQRAECRPIQDKVYMDLKKDSYKRALEPTRVALKLKSPVVTYKPKANHATNIAYEKMKKTEGKKSRDDKDRVMEMLFALFEKHQYYRINDLQKATKQPVTYLKEILKEVCNYNMKAPHKNMWELKPEYRHYKQEEEQTEKMEEESSDDD